MSTLLWQHSSPGISRTWIETDEDGNDYMVADCELVKPLGVEGTVEEQMAIVGQFYRELRLNPDAALQGSILGRNLVPVGNEADWEVDGVTYRLQLAENPLNGDVFSVYAKVGDWNNIMYVRCLD